MTEKRTGGDYDPTKSCGRMRLSEAEIYFAAMVAGNAGRIVDGRYEDLKPGDGVTVETEASKVLAKDAQVRAIQIDEIIESVTAFEEAPGTPPSKIWEGKLIYNSYGDGEPGDEMFGFFGPGGFVWLVDSGPEDTTTDLRIKTGIALRQRGRI